MKRTTVALALVAWLASGACGPKTTEEPAAEGVLELVGTTWQWQEFQDSADGEESRDIEVPDPARYTLALAADGVVVIRADCNRVSWKYTLDGGRLTFDAVGPATLAECGDASLDRGYLERLGHTATYVIADGKLHLNLKADAGNLVFEPAG